MGKGVGQNFNHIMLIYRHWVTMAYSEKLSDLRVLEKCESLFFYKKTNIAFIAFALALT